MFLSTYEKKGHINPLNKEIFKEFFFFWLSSLESDREVLFEGCRDA